MSQPDFFQVLTEKFPEMTPVLRPPTLHTVNGIGTNVLGKRDFDPDTGTYVTTMWFCLLLPLLALRSYRVADAPNGGWYFLGRVPLSGLARNWNWFLAVLLLTGASVGYFIIDSRNPNTIAGRQVAQADSLAAEGKVGQAADMLLPIAQGTSTHAIAAREKIGQLLDNSSADATELSRAFAVAVDMHRGGRTIDRLMDRALECMGKHEAAAALKVSDAVKPLAQEGDKKDAEKFFEKRMMILKALAAAKPDDLDILSELAVLYEARRDFKQCEELLSKHAAKLGTREGARILGQIYFQKDKIDEAYDLLAPYAEGKLKSLQDVSARVKSVEKRLWDGQIDVLNKGHAPGFDYNRFKTADQAAQQSMVIEYISARLKTDPEFRKAQDEVRGQAHVLNVALDLGMIHLRRGQAKTDPDARNKELEKSEQSFRAVSGLAGDEASLNLGQVYFWMGKHAEAKKQFDDVLKAHGREPKMLVQVSHVLRSVGNVSEARALVEEAYNKAANPQDKFSAASMRALMDNDNDDRIAWLKRCNPADKHCQANLSEALGANDMRLAKYDDAVKHFQQAVDLYASMPESAASLNNGALAYMYLYYVTGDRKHFEKNLAMMEKAVGFSASDSILVTNLAERTMESALWDVIGNKIDLSTLRQTGSISLFEFLCDRAQQRDAYREKVRTSAGIAKARGGFKTALILSPKSTHSYADLYLLDSFTEDLPALRDLLKRLEAVELDLGDARRRQLDSFQGKDDARLKEELASGAARLRQELDSAQMLGGPTWAVAASNWSNHHLRKLSLYVPISKNEIEALVKLAEDVYASAPSFGSRRSLMDALLLRARRNLVEKEPAFAAMARVGDRTLGLSYLIAYALTKDGPAQKACRENADIQRVQELIKLSLAKQPTRRSTWDWAMLRASHPQDAARIAKELQDDAIHQVNRKISEKISVLNAAVVMNRYFTLLMNGDAAGARAVLEQASRDGMPLPKN